MLVNKIKIVITKILRIFGISPVVLKNKLGLDFYSRDLKEIKRQKGSDSTFYFGQNYPMLCERFSSSGTMDGHYFHQDLYVAKRIYFNSPNLHLDIGSRIDGFVAHVAVFRSIEVLDIRRQESRTKNISFKQADLMQLPDGMINYCDSVSSLHAIEHFGLGRYGDPIDYWGYSKAIENITNILRKDGRFYFSVPIGPQRIEFNAHRVFSTKYLAELLNHNYDIERFSYVDDNGCFHENVVLDERLLNLNFNCNYGCGIFELIKK